MRRSGLCGGLGFPSRNHSGPWFISSHGLRTFFFSFGSSCEWLRSSHGLGCAAGLGGGASSCNGGFEWPVDERLFVGLLGRCTFAEEV